MPAVNSEIMRWARETTGLSTEDAATKLGIGSARGVEPARRLEQIENGEVEPSRAQLLKMSKVYKRPLITFYMAQIPVKADTGQDFRSLPEGLNPLEDARASTLIRDVHARHGIIKSALEEAEENFILSFVGSCRVEDGVDKTQQVLTQVLNCDREMFRSQKTSADSFRMLRDKVEAAGVFVLLVGDLGNYLSAIPVEVFRGFAIADKVAPIIVINDQDAKSAWAFTLLHEFAHILIGETGVSNASVERNIEKFCNEVASAFLVPDVDFGALGVNDDTEIEEAVALIGRLADSLKVSSSMIAYQLMLAGQINRNTWTIISNKFRELWLENKAKEKARRKASDAGAPSYFVLQRYRVGNALLSLSSRMISAGILSTTKVAKVLGVSPNNVYPVLHR